MTALPDDSGHPAPPTGSGQQVPLERRVLVLWRIRAGAGIAGLGLLGVVGGLVAGIIAIVGASLVVTAALAGAAWWWTGRVWRSWRFEVGDHALHLRHGVVTRRTSTIPYHRVQHIDLEAGPIERWLRLQTLVLRTASASTDSTVPGIDADDAEALRARILDLVGTGDAT